jgi:hypothetical protein
MIQDYLEDKAIEYWEAGSKNVSQGWIGIQCIYCDDHSNHLGINLTTARAKCWLCHESVNVVELIMEIEDCNWRKAKAIFNGVWEKDSHSLPPATGRIGRSGSRVLLPPLKKQWPKRYLKFLKKRNFDPKVLIKKYKLMPGEIYGYCSFRIIVPFFMDRKLITYTGMDITGKTELRYKDASYKESILIPKECLYNIDNLKGDRVVIVEGVTDVWRIGDGVVGLTTNKISDGQLLLLNQKELKKDLILLDADAREQGEEVGKMIIGNAVDDVDIGYLKRGDPDTMSSIDLIMVSKFLGR